MQVVKWYLSAFHAGRKGSVAKKPYNPILGEVFFCHWDLPVESEETSTVVSAVPVQQSSAIDRPFTVSTFLNLQAKPQVQLGSRISNNWNRLRNKSVKNMHLVEKD